jgi:hypothetical protein
MAERHPMPSGNWIELRDWHDLRRGDKKRAMSAITDTTRLIATTYEMTDALLALLVTNWSYQLPIPSVSPQSIDLLPIEDDDALLKLVEPAMAGLNGTKPDGDDPAQAADPASPTEPSAA